MRLILSVLLTCFLVFSISVKLNTPIDGLIVQIEESAEGKKLIEEKEIKAIIKHDLGYDINIAEVEQLNIYRLESILKLNERIDNVEIYLDKRNILHVKVEQKLPIVRIEMANGADYYLDYQGDKVPVTDIYRVPVVTGNVDNYTILFRNDKKNNLNSVLELAKKVHDDEFLSALIEQINIDSNNEITLIPKIGRDKILIGQIENLDEKFYKLKTYYERGIKNIGLEKFDELDLKIKGQIIGRQKDT